LECNLSLQNVSIFGGKDPIIVKLVVMPMSNHCDSYHVLICSNLSGEKPIISEQKVLEKMDPSLLILDALKYHSGRFVSIHGYGYG
jgi:hypothetical protein